MMPLENKEVREVESKSGGVVVAVSAGISLLTSAAEVGELQLLEGAMEVIKNQVSRLSRTMIERACTVARKRESGERTEVVAVAANPKKLVSERKCRKTRLTMTHRVVAELEVEANVAAEEEDAETTVDVDAVLSTAPAPAST